ncbi:MAG: hypothetical protein CM1200mP20_07770 [Pseudomonadota bacterium]|nr:MAG: hypothetical protein CM1200mP20_07770 [Pseudomonadota bacterium]
MSVIDRRRGIPVSLGIICIHVARSQGWETDGINFPSHFLIGLRVAGERSLVDPFNKVQILTNADIKQRLNNVSEQQVVISVVIPVSRTRQFCCVCRTISEFVPSKPVTLIAPGMS